MLHLVRKVRKTSTRRFKDQDQRLRIVLVVAKLHSKLHLKTYYYLYKCYRADFNTIQYNTKTLFKHDNC